MSRMALAFGFSITLLAVGGCKQQQNDGDAIRAGIMQHLAALGTLNMGAMDMEVHSVTLNGNQARAQVEFRPKTGAPPGAGMQVSYDLEKRDGGWVVLKTQPAGGMIQHPDPGQNPHQKQNVHAGALPNFSDVLNTGSTPTTGGLPPGHPPVAAATDQASMKRPR